MTQNTQTEFPILAGTSIVQGQEYPSKTRTHYLKFQSDGNLVVKKYGDPVNMLSGDGDAYVWGLDKKITINKNARVEMQSDGNLAVYDENGGRLWSALTQSHDPLSYLILTPNGALKLVSNNGREVQWSSDGNLVADPDPLAMAGYGWSQCRKLESPKITIMGTKAVTSAAMDVVKLIYSEITQRFKPDFPLNKLDDYVIYITNGEPWSELSRIAPVSTMWGNDANGVNLGDEIRGGTTNDFLWIDEQMICKTGVRTRNEAFEAKNRAGKDETIRTYDQVIHEFGHAIDNRYGLRDRIMEVYKGGWNPVEQFPWSIQSWFGTPVGTLSESESAFISEIFTSNTTFLPELYKP